MVSATTVLWTGLLGNIVVGSAALLGTWLARRNSGKEQRELLTHQLTTRKKEAASSRRLVKKTRRPKIDTQHRIPRCGRGDLKLRLIGAFE